MNISRESADNQHNNSVDGDQPLILLAEDEEYNLVFFKHVFNKLNLKFLHAENGRQAVEICRDNPLIRFVLMDIRMPEMNGIEATIEIRKFRPGLPVIALSAYEVIGDELKIHSAGFTTFLTKPISKENLIEVVLKYLNC